MIFLASAFPSLAFLTSALVVALVLTFARPFPTGDPAAVAALRPAYLGAVAAQAVHFLEEFLTGFPDRFPVLLGFPPWGNDFFVTFNVGWIVVWILAVIGVERRVRLALWPIWFLAVASIGNGIAHPLLALTTGGYFPGLVTSPLVGVFGVLLWRRLLPPAPSKRVT